MLFLFTVSASHIVASRSDQLLHERIERSHLGSGICQLIRHDGGNRRTFEVTPHRLREQATILRYLCQYQFPCTFDLIEVLHRTLCVGEVFKQLVLHVMHPVKGDRHRCFSSNDFFLCFLPLLMDALQFRCLCEDGGGQCGVGLLGMVRDSHAQRQYHNCHRFLD